MASDKNSNDIDKTAPPRKDSEYFRWMLEEYEGNSYVCDLETYELLYLNKVARATLNASLAEYENKFLGKKCYEVIQGRTTPCPFCTNKYLTEDNFYEWEFFNPILKRSFLIKNRIITWEGHRARIELSHDMYSAEYKLAKKDKEREALIKTIPGGFVRIDATDFKSVLWYGADFLNFIGYTKEQFRSELNSECGFFHPDDVEKVQSTMRKAKSTRQNLVTEVRTRTHSGKTRYMTFTLSYVSSENSWDGIASFYSIGLDTTADREEQNRQRKALEDAYQALQMANSAKTDFLSTMSHDIRTPMNAILGMTSVAQANLTYPDKISDCLQKINLSGQHLLSLINEVLDMSKIESGKIDIASETVNLFDLIDSIKEICRPLVAQKHQRFDIVTNRVNHKCVISDKERLQQVCLNLLSNAVKYTQEGGTIVFTISEIASLVPQMSLYDFVVQDNGIGMTPDFVPKIFEPFSRAEDSRISKIQGTGLGMSITENIVHMMNGTIAVKSESGVGSKFTVSCPFQLAEEIGAAADKTASETDNERLVSNENRERLRGKRLLLVDDNELNREIAKELLEMQGLIIEYAENGAEAVNKFGKSVQGYYEAILMDIQMPVMDGYAATEAIRAIDTQYSKSIPIIALTANAFVSDIGRAQSVGMNEHVSKPIDIDVLMKILGKWIVE